MRLKGGLPRRLMMCCTSTSRATSASERSIRWHCHHTASAHITATLRRSPKRQQLVDSRRELGRHHVIRVAAECLFLHAPFGESGRGLRKPPSSAK